jgi:hypothetical protein
MRVSMLVVVVGLLVIFVSAACGDHGVGAKAQGGSQGVALTDAAQPLLYNPSVPCQDPASMPPDHPPYDGTRFSAVGDLHDAAGPNLETTGFRMEYDDNGTPRSAEIDLRTGLALDPQALYNCGLLLDDDPNHHHMVAATGTIQSACGTFLKRRKIVVADRLIDLQPNATVVSQAGCAQLALKAAAAP